jgi:hypothetical protein
VYYVFTFEIMDHVGTSCYMNGSTNYNIEKNSNRAFVDPCVEDLTCHGGGNR